MERLKRKIDGSRPNLPEPMIREEEDKELGVIFYGSMENTIVEIDDMLGEAGISVSTCRVRALPLHPEVEDFVRRHDMTIVLEINRDGQLFGIIRKEFPPELIPKIHRVAYSNGMPPRARVYSDKILEVLNGVA
jgi:hypothetical protein